MNQFKNMSKPAMWLTALVMAASLAGCGGGGTSVAASTTAAAGATVAPGAAGTPGGTASDPTVATASPANNATNVSTSTNNSSNIVTGTTVTANFSQAMDPTTINSAPAGTLSTFTLKQTLSGTNVPGTVAMNAANTAATFTPSSALGLSTSYTATVTTAAKNAGGTAMANPVAWSFTTRSAAFTGQAPVDLGAAGPFAILSKTGITNVATSAVTGDVGTSPITGAAILLTCAQVTGTIYSVDATGPLPCRVTDATLLTAAIGAMDIAYADAAGRTTPDFTELGAGEIGSLTLAPGLYKWGTDVAISTTVTLSGNASDVWIFQIAGNVTQASATRVELTGGALAKNVFWQVGGLTGAVIGTGAHFQGVVMAEKAVNLLTGATASSRLFAKTEVTLQQNAVTQPAP